MELFAPSVGLILWQIFMLITYIGFGMYLYQHFTKQKAIIALILSIVFTTVGALLKIYHEDGASICLGIGTLLFIPSLIYLLNKGKRIQKVI